MDILANWPHFLKKLFYNLSLSHLLLDKKPKKPIAADKDVI